MLSQSQRLEPWDMRTKGEIRACLFVTISITNTRPQACPDYTQTSWDICPATHTHAGPGLGTSQEAQAPVCGCEDVVACGWGSPSAVYL